LEIPRIKRNRLQINKAKTALGIQPKTKTGVKDNKINFTICTYSIFKKSLSSMLRTKTKPVPENRYMKNIDTDMPKA